MSELVQAAPFGPWLDERVLCDDERWLVVDKPSGLVVHGGDERVAGDVVSRLRARLLAAGANSYLGVHQRLDVGTSGVLAFVRERAQNPAVAAEFEEHRAEKRYCAALEIAPGSPLARAESLLLEHRLEAAGERMRVVQSGGKACRAECRVLERSGTRALVELRPESGRTHQLRVQLSAVRAPIAGDRQYGGAEAPRLLLHAKSLTLRSLSKHFESPVPALFERWLRGSVAALGSPDELLRRVRDAACKRYPLLESTQAFRWVNAEADELFGVVVDWYAGYATLSLGSEEALARQAELSSLLHQQGARGVYLKVRTKADLRRLDHAELAPGTPVAGEAAEPRLAISEPALKVWVSLADGLSTGLFVDQRDNRVRVRELSAGARVLNLFAYTCGFSVAAALGGALRVTSVDLSKRALRRGEDNFRLNELDPRQHAFVQEDAVRYLQRAQARGDVYDWVVLDPPSFSTAGGGRVMRVERDYLALARRCIALLAGAGRLLAVTNHRGTSSAALRRMLLEAVRLEQRVARQCKELSSGLDCPDGATGPDPSKSVLLTLE